MRVKPQEMHMYGLEIVGATTSDAEVKVPISGISITFRCPKRAESTPSNLFEVARMSDRNRLDEPIRVSAFALESMRKAAASAIAAKRKAESTKMCARVLPFQLKFNNLF